MNDYMPMPPKEEQAISVTDLNGYIKKLFDEDVFLNRVLVKGEISNFKHHSSGHLYFSLKDEGGIIRAVMFRSAASKLAFRPEEGMKVLAHGTVSSFVRDGQYQLYVTSMEPDGVGSLYLAFEKLKRKLEAEGLFREERKKPLPRIPSVVGLITSPTGAAVRDMIQVMGRRFPYAKILLYPALVQGPDAPESLIRGLEHFDQSGCADVVIIGRGGGSIEDLWGFNNEALARRIAAMRIPVISAVGHEVDFTICDFVADRRAPTPSAAAELAVPETRELSRRIENIVGRTELLLMRKIERLRQHMRLLSERRVFSRPEELTNEKRMLLLSYSDALQRAWDTGVLQKRTALEKAAGRLDALSPLAVFRRGYAIAEGENGQIVSEIGDIPVGDRLSVRVQDGIYRTVVQSKDKGET